MYETVTRTFKVERVRDEDGVITDITHDARLIAGCNPEILDWTGLRRGAVVTFETVEITVVSEKVPEYRYGFNGQKVERTKSRTETVLESETRRLSSYKGSLLWKKVV